MSAFDAPRAVRGIHETFDAFELAPHTPVFGAEIRNIRVAKVNESEADQLRRADVVRAANHGYLVHIVANGSCTTSQQALGSKLASSGP